MATEFHPVRQLFGGGAITTIFPSTFQDISNIRQVPNNQEVFADPSRDESLVIELLEFKHEVADNLSASWFLRDLAQEQDAELHPVIEQSGVVAAPESAYRTTPAVLSTAVGQMNLELNFRHPFMWMGNLHGTVVGLIGFMLFQRDYKEWKHGILSRCIWRLKEVDTDVLIVSYEPIVINPLSESALSVGAGLAVPAVHFECTPMAEIFRQTVSNLKITDWNLFG